MMWVTYWYHHTEYIRILFRKLNHCFSSLLEGEQGIAWGVPCCKEEEETDGDTWYGTYEWEQSNSPNFIGNICSTEQRFPSLPLSLACIFIRHKKVVNKYWILLLITFQLALFQLRERDLLQRLAAAFSDNTSKGTPLSHALLTVCIKAFNVYHDFMSWGVIWLRFSYFALA